MPEISPSIKALEEAMFKLPFPDRLAAKVPATLIIPLSVNKIPVLSVVAITSGKLVLSVPSGISLTAKSVAPSSTLTTPCSFTFISPSVTKIA